MPLQLTYIIIAANVIASLYAWNHPDVWHRWQLNPYQIHHRKQYFRFITSGFIHLNYQHLIFNMLVLYFFGETLELYFFMVFGQWSPILFLLFYFSSLVVSSLVSYWKYRDIANYNALGASGAVSAVLFATIFFNPWGGLEFLFLPFFSIPSIVFAVLYLIYSYYGATRHFGDGIGHDAHLFGALYGWVFPFVLNPNLGLNFLELLSHPTF